jgi:hypothetical protein
MQPAVPFDCANRPLRGLRRKIAIALLAEEAT